jgi:hypothetical protein
VGRVRGAVLGLGAEIVAGTRRRALVLVIPNEQPKSLKFLCPCGCGEIISVNLCLVTRALGRSTTNPSVAFRCGHRYGSLRAVVVISFFEITKPASCLVKCPRCRRTRSAAGGKKTTRATINLINGITATTFNPYAASQSVRTHFYSTKRPHSRLLPPGSRPLEKRIPVLCRIRTSSVTGDATHFCV